MENKDIDRNSASIDELLDEIRGITDELSGLSAPASGATGRDWSLDDIDRLISGAAPASSPSTTPRRPQAEPVIISGSGDVTLPRAEQHGASTADPAPRSAEPAAHSAVKAEPPAQVPVPKSTEPEPGFVSSAGTGSTYISGSGFDFDAEIEDRPVSIYFSKTTTSFHKEDEELDAIIALEKANAAKSRFEAIAMEALESRRQTISEIDFDSDSTPSSPADEPESSVPSPEPEAAATRVMPPLPAPPVSAPAADSAATTVMPAVPKKKSRSTSSARRTFSIDLSEPPAPADDGGSTVVFNADRPEEPPKATIDLSEHIPDYDPMSLFPSGNDTATGDTIGRLFTDYDSEPTREIMDEPDEPGEPVERPGMVVEKSGLRSTSELEPLPTVISADKILNIHHTIRRDSPADSHSAPAAAEDEETPGQIVMPEFNTPAESEPSVSSPEDVARSLRSTRTRKINAFVTEKKFDDTPAIAEVEGTDEDEPLFIFQKEEKPKNPVRFKEGLRVREYESLKDRLNVFQSIKGAASFSLKHAAVNIAFELIFALLYFLPSILSAADISSELFSKGGPVLYVLNAVILVAAIAFNNKIFRNGLRKLRDRTPDAESAAALSSAAAFIHSAVIAVVLSGGTTSVSVFPMTAVFGFFMIDMARYVNAQNLYGNFEICAYRYKMGAYTVHSIEDGEDADKISAGMLLDNADLLYSSKTNFPSDFVRNSTNFSADNRAASVILPLAAAAAVVAGILTAFFTLNPLSVFTSVIGTFCLCCPVFSSFIPALHIKNANRRLNREGSLITGFDAAEDISGANAVIIDSGDLFDRSKCVLHGMVNFKTIRADDILSYAATMVIKSGGPLCECFEKVISGDHSLLPRVRDLTYEDNLGISARIRENKVLLGNRSLMEHHGVAMNDAAQERKYLKDNRRIIYLAVGGKLAAMFVVSYQIDENLIPDLRRLEDAGTQIIVRTNDVNVTEELLAESFGMESSSFTILGSLAGRIFTRKRDEVSDRSPVKIAHDGSAFTMLRAVSAAQRLCRSRDTALVLQIIFCVAAFVGSAVLTGLSLLTAFNGVTSVIFLAVCAAVSTAAIYLSERN